MDEVKAAKFVTLTDSCGSGSEVYRGLFTSFNTGTNHGFSIVMNRVINLLIQHGKLAVDSTGNTTFAKLKKIGLENDIELPFTDLVVDSPCWEALVTNILLPFRINKVAPKKIFVGSYISGKNSSNN